MKDSRITEILHILDPAPGERLWFGGASPLGCLRGITPTAAAWRPSPDRHSIWELSLHMAYWKYAIRRNLEGSPVGGFPRSPSNWPRVPDVINAASWKRDRDLFRSEHEKFLAAAGNFDPKLLDRKARGNGAYRYADLLFGIVMHDTYHVAQIQLLKRLYRTANP